jgi:ribonucleoside-diphosphate reductase alpha subunit
MENQPEMYVMKRDGTKQTLSFDKISTRIKKLSFIDGIDIKPLKINPSTLTIKVIQQLYDGIKTQEIDTLTAEICASNATNESDYGLLASRIVISNHHKQTQHTFKTAMEKLYNRTDIHGKQTPLITQDVYDFATKYEELIEKEIQYTRDYDFDYFGFKTLERAYLMKVDGVIVERPQHMWMRVAIGIHNNVINNNDTETINMVMETYHHMSKRYFTHATPTLFNAGTPHSQMSSCYLIGMESDSINGMYNTLGDCAAISKWAGGIGLHIHNIRGNGSHIRGTNGKSSGLVPLMRVFNATARHVNQGGKRNGSFAMYIEPWHSDIEEFIELRKNHGDEEARARDLFYALWIPDLFMKRVKDNGNWTLMCPDTCRGLHDLYGKEFEELYEKYENEGKGLKTIPARKLWFQILDSQIETGTPYMLFKDRINQRSNQKNIGIIKSSNLCAEIAEFSNDKETAVCNLASIGLSRFVKPFDYDMDTHGKVTIFSRDGCVYCKLSKYELDKHNISYELIDLSNDDERKAQYALWKDTMNLDVNTMPQIFFGDEYIGGYEELIVKMRPSYDFDELHKITRMITRNLNKIIDKNFYPTDKTFRSNMSHRPIGIGVQGLADVFVMMNVAFDSQYARKLNRNIFKTIYHAALTESNEISKSRSLILRKLFEDLDSEEFEKFKNSIMDKSSETIKNDNGLCLFKHHETGEKLYHNEVVGYDKEYNYIPPKYLYNDSDKEGIKKSIRDLDLIGSYSSFIGSPASEGILQFDLWKKPAEMEDDLVKYDWDTLKKNIMKYGLRNSLLVALMPTASTSQILGNNECFEPFTSNIYMRRTLAGSFMMVNKYLINELSAIGMWNTEIKNSIIARKGSVQHLSGIPKMIREKYKIVWEIPMRSLIDMSADRGLFVCQTQSMNLWMETPKYDKLTAMHMYSWSKGLKTGIYYLRTKAKAEAQQFTIDPSTTNQKIMNNTEKQDTTNMNNVEVRDDEEGCLMCSG